PPQPVQPNTLTPSAITPTGFAQDFRAMEVRIACPSPPERATAQPKRNARHHAGAEAATSQGLGAPRATSGLLGKPFSRNRQPRAPIQRADPWPFEGSGGPSPVAGSPLPSTLAVGEPIGALARLPRQRTAPTLVPRWSIRRLALPAAGLHGLARRAPRLHIQLQLIRRRQAAVMSHPTENAPDE